MFVCLVGWLVGCSVLDCPLQRSIRSAFLEESEWVQCTITRSFANKFCILYRSNKFFFFCSREILVASPRKASYDRVAVSMELITHFSSALGRLARRRNTGERFIGDPLQVFSVGGHREPFRHGYGRPLFDVVRPSIPSTVGSLTCAYQ